jgi:hypothetical protein
MKTPYLLLIAAVAALFGLQVAARQSDRPGYAGATDAMEVQAPGCNAVAFAQIPGADRSLFIGRQLITGDGRLAGVTGPNDCSGGDARHIKTDTYNRWSLMIDRLDWKARRFSIVKPLLDTSHDPRTGKSKAVISGGPMRGAIISSAHDPSIAVHRGHYLVAFECTIANYGDYGVDGTSACISFYDPKAQTLDMKRTRVIVNARHDGTAIHDASVPVLFSFKNRLYLYWSSLTFTNGAISGSTQRGAELAITPAGVEIKGSRGRMVDTLDPLTSLVWGTQNDPLSDSLASVSGVLARGDEFLIFAAKGGTRCGLPLDRSPGCFRLAIMVGKEPFGEKAFNRARQLAATALPSNPQEYSKPIVDPQGRIWLMGLYRRPVANGWSDRRPAPGNGFFRNREVALIMFPLPATR